MKFNTNVHDVNNTISLGERAYCLRKSTRLSWREIGTMLVMSDTWVRLEAETWAKDTSAPWPLPGPPKVGHSPLTQRQKHERYERYMKGTSVETIAEDEGVLVEAVVKSIKKYAKDRGVQYPYKKRG
tara:strand:- start:3061 stop:3441 length:381 start_codon:yes stop_codon:yes gene_type:complete